jgi:N-formylglutamate deformylase
MRTADDEFLEAVEACTLPNASFHHRDHVRLAWIYVCRFGYQAGSERMAASIRRYAAHHGATEKYHETITRAWMDLVQHAVASANHRATFDAFIAANADLSDPHALAFYYSAELLASPAARREWVTPDLRSLPSKPAM